MKNIFRILALLISINALAQQSLILDSKSMTVPRYANLNAIQAAISTPQTGMMVYNIATQTNWTYNGTIWLNAAGAGASQWASSGDNISYGGENTYTVNANLPIPIGTPNGPNGILNSSINVPLNRNIIDQNEVTIFVNLIGQYNFETAIALISPTGVVFDLFYPVQSPQKYLSGAISFNSAALSNIDFTVPTYDLTGTYLPSIANTLEGLSGLNTQGNWTLRIEDSYHSFGAMGTLVSWGIKFGDSKKVGIGTLSPQTTLDVYGNIKAHSLTASTLSVKTLNSQLIKFPNLELNKKLVLWDNNTSNDFEYYGLGINSGMLKYHIGNSLSDHVFFAGSQIQIGSSFFPISNELFRIKGNGKVGIGTSSPTTKLEVAGEIASSNTNAFRMVQGNYGAFWRNDGPGSYFLLTNSGDQFGNFNSLRPLTIDNANGNIAFGNQALFVHHDSHIIVTKSIYIDANNTNAGNLSEAINFGGVGTGEGIASKRTAGGNQWGLDFFTSGQSRLSINNNGNVGIGTNNPISRLDLAGGNNWDLNNTNGDFSIGNSTYRLKFGIALDGGGAGAAGIRAPTGVQILNLAAGSSAGLSLFGNGNATLAGTLTQNSDRRLKKNIIPLENTLDKLQNLDAYSYQWIDETRDQNTQIGLIAQEVEKIYPNLVKEDTNGYKSVNYIGLVPILIEAIKEQQSQIYELQMQLKEIVTKNRLSIEPSK